MIKGNSFCKIVHSEVRVDEGKPTARIKICFVATDV
jgi:hypothetical protein